MRQMMLVVVKVTLMGWCHGHHSRDRNIVSSPHVKRRGRSCIERSVVSSKHGMVSGMEAWMSLELMRRGLTQLGMMSERGMIVGHDLSIDHAMDHPGRRAALEVNVVSIPTSSELVRNPMGIHFARHDKLD